MEGYSEPGVEFEVNLALPHDKAEMTHRALMYVQGERGKVDWNGPAERVRGFHDVSFDEAFPEALASKAVSEEVKALAVSLYKAVVLAPVHGEQWAGPEHCVDADGVAHMKMEGKDIFDRLLASVLDRGDEWKPVLYMNSSDHVLDDPIGAKYLVPIAASIIQTIQRSLDLSAQGFVWYEGRDTGAVFCAPDEAAPRLYEPATRWCLRQAEEWRASREASAQADALTP